MSKKKIDRKKKISLCRKSFLFFIGVFFVVIPIIFMGCSASKETHLADTQPASINNNLRKIRQSYNVSRVTLVKTTTNALNQSAQGGAAYGKYLFQFSNYMQQVYVLDLETNEILEIQTFLQANNQYHCNNANFGTQLYEDTGFPLLYVSMENKDQHKALVFAVSQNKNDFIFELVQTIVYPSNKDAGMYYQNCIIDGENGCIFIEGYSVESWKSDANGNKLIIKQYKLPALSDGEIVELSLNDVISTRFWGFAYATQGVFIREGKLYQIFGGECDGILRILDIENAVYQEYNLNLLGLEEEPESICYFNGEYYITTVYENVLKFTISNTLFPNSLFWYK